MKNALVEEAAVVTTIPLPIHPHCDLAVRDGEEAVSGMVRPPPHYRAEYPLCVGQPANHLVKIAHRIANSEKSKRKKSVANLDVRRIWSLSRVLHTG